MPFSAPSSICFRYFTFVFVLRHVHHAFEIVGKQNFLFLRRGFLAQAIPGPVIKIQKTAKDNSIRFNDLPVTSIPLFLDAIYKHLINFNIN